MEQPAGQRVNERPVMEEELLSYPAIINMLAPTKSGTFESYACDIFMPFLSHHLTDVKRIDMVLNRFLKERLKQIAHITGGTGIRWKVTGHGCRAKNWKSFMWCNKKELFLLLASCAIANVQSKHILVEPAMEMSYTIILST